MKSTARVAPAPDFDRLVPSSHSIARAFAMASVFTHAAFAGALAYSVRPIGPSLRFYALAAFCSIAPDFDVIGFISAASATTFESVWTGTVSSLARVSVE